MATLRSPGVVVREKDLTNGRADIANANIAGFASPFVKGEIGSPVLISSEADLITYFGEPTAENAEYWLSATNYLAYGGTLSVVRVDSDELKNSIARTGNYVDEITVTNAQLNGKYVSAPNVTISGGSGTGATAVANINSEGNVTQVIITNRGSGYTSAPDVTIAPVGTTALASVARGTQATAEADVANLSGGSLTGTADITNAGSGYSSAPAVTVSGGGGTGGTATATVLNGQITQITLSGGSGYTSAPTLGVAQPNGVVVTITSGGSNYDPNETYTISVSGGTATTPFSGTAVVSEAGVVTGVTTTNFGNYTNFTGLTVTIPQPGTTATAVATIAAEAIKIQNSDVYEGAHNANTNGWLFAAKTPGTWGDNLRVCIIDNGPRQSLTLTSTSPSNSNNIALGAIATSGSKRGKVIDVTSQTSGSVTTTTVHVVMVDSNGVYIPTPSAGALFADGDTVTIGTTSGNTVNTVDNGENWYSTKEIYPGSGIFWNSVVARPRATDDAISFYGSEDVLDCVHAVVVDEDGGLTGAKNTILESWTYASKANNARGAEGGLNYYKSVISSGSQYVYVGDTIFAFQGKETAFEPVGAKSYSLNNGASYPTLSSGQWNVSIDDIRIAYDAFRNLETVSLDYLVMGPGMPTSGDTLAKLNHIASIAALRKDCMAFASPFRDNLISSSGQPLSNSDIVKNIKNFFAPVASNSYLVLDCNYKYVYDRWNDVYRYIPCNTDVAGLVADTAIRNEPWFSPAGFSRGGIRNAAKLAWNPSKTDRDELYANRVNPIAVFPGQGAVLFGDKTALSNPSAFDRINVRRLFLVLERAIEQAAKAQLFEINDEVTRNVFKAIVEPFLRDVQSRRGLYDYLVVCDGTNNPSSVVDNNEFVADIYIQPARSINFITLTFTATRTGIQFSEVVAR
jgi:hypothetical protein